jgi:phosphoketolase
MPAALSPDPLETMAAYWRAANCSTAGQIYPQDNPLLETPLKLDIARFSTGQPQNLIRVSGSPCRWN